MAKTIEEIKKHCIETGYGNKARTQICAFLVGAGLKSTHDIIKFKVGDGRFENFVSWYNQEKEEELVFERGRFVLLDFEFEPIPALILDEFEDSCLCVDFTGLVCVRKDMIIGYADVEDIASVLESLEDKNLTWDIEKQKLVPYDENIFDEHL